MLFADPSYCSGQGVHFWSGAITCPIDVAFLRCSDPHQELKAALEAAIRAPLRNRMLDVRFELLDYAWLDPLPGAAAAGGPSQVAPGRVPGEVPPGDWSGMSFTASSSAARVEMVLETRRLLFADATKEIKDDIRDDSAEVEISLELSENLCDELSEKWQLNKTFVTSLESMVTSHIRAMNSCIRSTDNGSRASRKSDNSLQISTTSSQRSASDKKNSRGNTDSRTTSRFAGGDPLMKSLPPMDYELFALSWRLGLGQEEAMRNFNRLTNDLRTNAISAQGLSALAELAKDPAVGLPVDVRRIILAS
jgi:hypothetical protein